ncbi:MAG: GGDEF domain-containing protein [Lachnospirales bacterium]
MKNLKDKFLNTLEYYNSIYGNVSLRVLSVVLMYVTAGLISGFFGFYFYAHQAYEMIYFNFAMLFFSIYAMYLVLIKQKNLKAQYVMAFVLCTYCIWMTIVLGFNTKPYLVFFPLIFAYFNLSPEHIEDLTKSAIYTMIAFLISFILSLTVPPIYENQFMEIEYVNVFISILFTFFVIISIEISERINKKNTDNEINNLREKIYYDYLTGLKNKKFLEEKIASYIDFKDAYIILIDIDFFKKINDTYGHTAGDYALKELAKIINESFKEYGCVVRWGGEEFLILANEKNFERLLNKLYELKSNVEDKTFKYQNNSFNITTTIGISKVNHDVNFTKNIKAADNALYYGKAYGRNLIIQSIGNNKFIKHCKISD